jgi:dienelactone hydrolase
VLREAGMGTLLFDLLSAEEEMADARTGRLRFDIPFLSARLVEATRWVMDQADVRGLGLGCFGASTGAAAALVAAANLKGVFRAVVSRGGRPDLAGDSLEHVPSPTLLIVGGDDHPVLELNQEAYRRLRCEKSLRVIPKASHLFEEPGTLETAAKLASEWFAQHLQTES